MAATRAADSALHFPRPFEGMYGLSLLTAILSPRSDLIAWIERDRPAIGSPPLVKTLREG